MNSVRAVFPHDHANSSATSLTFRDLARMPGSQCDRRSRDGVVRRGCGGGIRIRRRGHPLRYVERRRHRCSRAVPLYTSLGLGTPNQAARRWMSGTVIPRQLRWCTRTAHLRRPG